MQTTTATLSIPSLGGDCNQLGREGKEWCANQAVFAAVVVGLGSDERRRHALDERGHLGARKTKEAIDDQLRTRRGLIVEQRGAGIADEAHAQVVRASIFIRYGEVGHDWQSPFLVLYYVSPMSI